MVTGIKHINSITLFTRLKKHYCPHCNERLRLVKKSKIVNSCSPEAKDYDFSLVDSSFVGDVKFVWEEFQCPACHAEFTAKDVNV